MSRKARIRAIIIAVMVGVVTLAVGFLQHGKKVPVHKILVAGGQIEAGQPLQKGQFTTNTMKGAVPKGFVTSWSQVKGKQLIYGLQKGEPVVSSDLAVVPMRNGIPKNDVGVFVPVTLTSSADVQPGQYVDVVWGGGSAVANQGQKKKLASSLGLGKTLFYHVLVVSVLSQNGNPVGSGKKSGSVSGLGASVPAAVELAIQTNEASSLVSAAAAGSLWLVAAPWSGSTGSYTNGASPAKNPGFQAPGFGQGAQEPSTSNPANGSGQTPTLSSPAGPSGQQNGSAPGLPGTSGSPPASGSVPVSSVPPTGALGVQNSGATGVQNQHHATPSQPQPSRTGHATGHQSASASGHKHPKSGNMTNDIEGAVLLLAAGGFIFIQMRSRKKKGAQRR